MALKWLSGGLSSSRDTVHFVTWRVSSWQSGLSEAERDTVARVIRQRKDQYGEVLSFVVMDDHVHVLMKCDMTVDRVVETWKSFSAHHLRELHGRSGAVWQRDTFHRPIRDENDLRARSRYIAANPWKRWPFVGRYPWVWESGRQAQAFRPERAGVFASLAHLVTGNAK